MDASTGSLGASDPSWGGADAHVLVVERARVRILPLGTRLVIGRDPSCDVALDDPAASRRHALLFGTEPPVIEDAGSRHGTRVGARVLRKGERCALGPSDVVHVGRSLVVVRRGSPKEQAPAGLVARDERMVAALSLARSFAASRLPLFLRGESGTGKELVAELVHLASDRARGPLVRLSCANLSGPLLEAELFGHAKGAFTGAVADKPGLFEAAHGGTLFLDEIAEMELEVQAKLLRVLESGEILRVGERKARIVDVRLVSASHTDLAERVAEGRFRSDLLYRVCGAKVELPPLRARPADVVALAEHFVAEHAAVTPGAPTRLSRAAWEAITAHAWPGNVRELKLTLLRAALLAAGREVIDAPELGLGDADVAPRANAGSDDPERARIEAALDACGHSQKRAAEVLGVSRRTLMRRMDALGIARPRKGRGA